MSNTYEGNLAGENLKFGIVISRFNEFIGSKIRLLIRRGYEQHL